MANQLVVRNNATAPVVAEFDQEQGAVAQNDRIAFLQLMKTMAGKILQMEERIQIVNDLNGAMGDRMTQLDLANQGLYDQISLQGEDNQNLQLQNAAQARRIDELAARVDEVGNQNATLRQQVNQEAQQRQIDQKNHQAQRQQLTEQLRNQQIATQRAQLEAQLSSLGAELTNLNTLKLESQLALGGASGFSGIFWGALLGGPPGALIGGLGVGAFGTAIATLDSESNENRQTEIETKMQQIRDCMSTLGQ